MGGIFSWSSTAGSNAAVDGINIGEGCPSANLNNASRSIMAIIRQTFASALEGFFSGASALPIANGGTGGTSASAARTALGLGAIATEGTISNDNWSGTDLSIANGGTGQSTAAAAIAALGVAVSGTSASGKCQIGALTLAWIDFSANANTTTASGYGLGHTYTSYAKAWINGGRADSGQDENAPYVSSAGLTSANVFNAVDHIVPCTLFSIGV